MPVKILQLITELDVGGAEKSLARLLAHLDRDRFVVNVACLYGGSGPVANEIRALGIPVLDLGMSAKWRWDAFWRLYNLLCRERPTILHTWMFHSNIAGRVAGRLAGVPIIISGERTMGMESRWRYWLIRLTDPLTDCVVCVSPQVANFIAQQVGIPRYKISVIPNGIELWRFKSMPSQGQARLELGLPCNQMLLGSVARLDPVKRLDVLFQALVSMPDIHAVLVGGGSQSAELRALTDRLGLAGRIRFAGQQQNVVPWLAAMDVFVLSSDREGMSNALLEAMAAGLPVVATAVGGNPDVVEDGVTGFLVPPRDPVAMAEALSTLMHDPQLRLRMGLSGRKRVLQHFDAEQVAQQTQTLYERLLVTRGLC
jgi:glycosyltransferase involved in cell wall biosynthesis